MDNDHTIPTIEDESWLDEYEAYCAAVAELVGESYVDHVLFGDRS